MKSIAQLFHRGTGRNQLNLFLLDEDYDAAIAEIDSHPNEVTLWSTREGFFDGSTSAQVLPLHVAVSLRAPLYAIRAIVEAYPTALGVKETSFKRLPLHISTQFGCCFDVVQYLVEQYPAAALEADTLGRLPIHYSCSNGAPLPIIRTLLQANSAATLYSDYRGWLPLHVAIHFGAETDVIRQFLVSCPAAACLQTKKGSTALSLAEKVSTKNNAEVLALIRSANQTAAKPSHDRRSPPPKRSMPAAA
mmetsp:Transcript_33003/g.78814  ORF Transcript_33003/g.78814 Transcript_33003/m.78814 type:complete len:248 (-) Transcript_33003:88-831(-)